ncbi:pyridoxal phosphate-dependent aminotransferase [Streptomyces sp. NPDC048182]|uniref:pyridoxal phosphate-dependent aminotransferase n=1 Tax=Streptomyces sp. NPDC048182 TaxID=3365507 RepID=UPI003722A817
MSGNVTSLFRGGDAAGPVDFRLPGNPYFPTPALFEELAALLPGLLTRRPAGADTVAAELGGLLRLPPRCVVPGNGATELITWLDRLLVRDSLAVPVPVSGRWTEQAVESGKRVDMFPLQESGGFALDPERYAGFVRARGTRVAVLCNPNNPDGGFLPRAAVVRFLDALADLDLVVVDETFLEFADAEAEPSAVREAVLRPNVVVLRSLGRSLGLPGVRCGYLVANPALAGRVRDALPRWNLNSVAEQVVFMLRDHGAAYAESLRRVRRDRASLARRLAALPGLTVYPSQGNYLSVRLPVGAEGTVVRDRLLSGHGVLVRECGDLLGSSSRFLRLAVRPEADAARLVSGLEGVLYGAGAGVSREAPGASGGYRPGRVTGGYSSGTAAVDRLIGETNGAGLRTRVVAARPESTSRHVHGGRGDAL